MAAINKSSKDKTDALSALLTAALALPGISAAAPGGYRASETLLNFHHADYDEQGNRMSVTTDQAFITTPVGRDFEGHFNAIQDVTSGASPVVNFLDTQGNPHQFVETGASIKDRREIYETSLGYYGDNSYASFGIGKSTEDDYISNYGSVSYRLDLNQKQTSLLAGAGMTSDEVWNSYNPDVFLEEPSIYNRRKKRELMVGISQVLNQTTVVQLNVTNVRNSGSLSDPYKKVYVVDEGIIDFRGLINVAGLFDFIVDAGLIEALNRSGITRLLNESPLIDVVGLASFIFGLEKDTRPDSREQWLILLRASHYFEATNSALHVDYRYADDSWDANSHTLELKWNVGLGADWQISPGVRYYSQSSAFFYDTFFESIPEDGYMSVDYRLAGFGAISKKLGVSKTFERAYTFYVDFEQYERRHSYEIGGETKGDAIDDYDFKILSFSVDYRF